MYIVLEPVLKPKYWNWHHMEAFGMVPSPNPSPSPVREKPLRTGQCGNVEQSDWLLDLLGTVSVFKTSPQNLPNSPCAPPSISYKYPWTIGAAYPTTVPHSQSDTAGSPAHLDPACQSHSTYPALRHGGPPGRAVGGVGRQHPCWGDGAAGSRSDPGKAQPGRAASGRDGSCPSCFLSSWKMQRQSAWEAIQLKGSSWLEALALKWFVLPQHSLMSLRSKSSRLVFASAVIAECKWVKRLPSLPLLLPSQPPPTGTVPLTCRDLKWLLSAPL